MKIAFLITAYSSTTLLNNFIQQVLQYEGSFVFIHIDKKSLINKESIISSNRIKIYGNPIEVSWGDYSQILAIRKLMEFAKSNGEFDYYSLHSESDMLVRPINQLVDFLIKDNAYAYLWCHRMPYEKWQYGGGMARIALHWPKVFRKKLKWNSPLRYLRSIYGRFYTLHIFKEKKLPNNIEFWGRCDWFTLRKDCVYDMLNYIENHKEYDDLFYDSLIGSEIYFTTLACNLGKNKKVITDNSLRYIDFKNTDPKKPGSPKELEFKDIVEIEKSKYYFARKFVDCNYEIIKYYFKKTFKSEKNNFRKCEL